MADKQRVAPDLLQHQAAWKAGLRFCSNCRTWVRAEEAHRQFRCISAIHVCRACIMEEDEREKRVAPEAVIDLKPVPMPNRLLLLWSAVDAYKEEADGD